jgi:hypothetical protein
MRIAVPACALLLLAAAAHAYKLPGDVPREVVPGLSVGPVSISSDRGELVDVFGEPALTDTMIHMGEGTYEGGTIVLPGTELELSVVWADASMSRADRITARGSAWTAPGGVTTGMTLREVADRVGEFRLTGFAWDYGGTADMEGTDLDDLLLRFRLPEDASLEGSTVVGDEWFPSDHPGMREANPVLATITVMDTEE